MPWLPVLFIVAAIVVVSLIVKGRNRKPAKSIAEVLREGPERDSTGAMKDRGMET